MHFVDAMHAAGAVPACLVADARMVKKYGMGMVFPGGGGSLAKLRNAGYIIQAPTRRALAAQIGVDPEGLERSVGRVNAYAKSGVDADFHKGEAAIDREFGARAAFGGIHVIGKAATEHR